jgi:hypothetical protein
MEAPVSPIEPGQRPEDEDVINHAMALAIVEIKKALKDRVVVKTNVSTWRGVRGEVTVSVPGTDKEWKEYQTALDQYRDDLITYEAERHGVSREHYIAARDKLNEYNRKKCDKAEDRDIDYYLSNMIEVPDDEIVVAS